jgi:hypothetical protein
LFVKLVSVAAAGQGRRHDHETTVDHALMRTRPCVGKERNLISERPRLALAGKKVQGARLGNRANLAEAQAKGAEALTRGADPFAANVLPIVRQIQASRVTGYRNIAAALNTRGIRTARGGGA